MRPTYGRALAIAAVSAIFLTGCSGTSSPNTSAPNRGAPAHNYPAPTPGDAVGPEVDTNQQNQSTFAIDIDTASYGFARRQIMDGHMPDPSTVRPEEFVNAFRQDYPQPAGDGFTVSLDGARLPRTQEDATNTRLLRIGLQTRAEDPANRADAALTFVVDVSGSMSEPGRLDLVQDALHTLVDQLRDTDSVAIVSYETQATVLREMTPVRNRSTLHRAIDRLE